MPIDLASSLYRHLLGRLPADRAYTRADLHAGALPGPVATLLDRTLDRWVEYERAQRRSDWFDYDDPAVRAAGDRYFEALSRTARLPPSAWAESLEGAVRLVVRHLVTPVRALTDAVFQGDPDPLPAAVVRERLALFDAYPYFVEIAGAYLERKHAEALDPDGLFDLLARIDRRVTAGYGPDEWIDLLEPLFTLARYLPGQAGIPAPLLARFFEAKSVSAVANRLRRRGDALDEAALRAVLIGEIEEVTETEEVEKVEEVEEVREMEEDKDEEQGHSAWEHAPIQEEHEAESQEHDDPEREHHAIEITNDVDWEREPERAPEPQPEEAFEPDEEPEPETVEPDEPGELIPLWQRFAGTSDELEDEEESEATDGPVPLWQRFASSGQAEAPERPPVPPPSRAGTPSPLGAPPAPAASLADLERRVLGVLPSGRRQQYVRHLTGGSEADYEAVLRALDRAGSWTEAAQVIAQHIFRKHRVDIYSEHAVEFTDTVEARFRR